MREILFRGKRLDNGEWVEGYFLRNTEFYGKVDEHSYIINYKHSIGCFGRDTHIEVDPDTVGQFTGLYDKNGKRIFEGDVVKIPDDYDEFGHNAGEIYEVYFFLGGFRLKPKYTKARGYWLEDDRTVEVIGNIHDNPELLEVQA